MAVCQNGHDSASDDFCDVCGIRIAASPGNPQAPAPSSATGAFPTGAMPTGGLAAGQGAPQAPAPGADACVTWTAVVAADRAYYDQVRAASGTEGAAIGFPAYYAERRFRLAGAQMRIGRHSVSRGLEPEIDLTGPPVDPGISRLHAVLIALDGGWAVLDPGSANGTLLNGTEVRVGDQVPLHDGDCINLGAWTAITVHRG